MMTTETLITSKDPKGIHATNLFEVAYNKAKLNDEQAQRLNENGGEFQKEIIFLIQKHSALNQYASEVTSSSCMYPKEYKGPKSIQMQIGMVATEWGINSEHALKFAENLPALPEGAEGWFAIPKVSAIAKKFFSASTDPAEQYCEAVKLVIEKIAKSRKFRNWRKGQITTAQLRQTARTMRFIEQLENKQEGDILIIAAQYGLRHRGKSVRRARRTFTGDEFGLGAFALGCMALVHPERYVRWEELETDCAGDEFADTAGSAFSEVPVWCVDDGGFRFDSDGASKVDEYYGSASAFVPHTKLVHFSV